MIEILRIVASSWPIAFMFLCLIIAFLFIYFTHWMNKKDEEHYIRQSNNAMTVNRER